MIKDFNLRPKTIKFLKVNVGSALFDIGLSNCFGYAYSRKGNKSKNKQMGLHQTKNFCTVKETMNKTERWVTQL